jgi:chaperonin cofactor prefoldin
MELTIGAETGQQILSLLINLDKKVDALTERVEALEGKVDIITARVEALTARVDSLEINLCDFRKEVKVELRALGERVTILEKKVVMIESRQIDIEQKFVAMDIQMESRFYSLEALLDKNAEPPGARKNIPKQVTKGRG